jgi:membrane-associated phospholipid phosphatase
MMRRVQLPAMLPFPLFALFLFVCLAAAVSAGDTFGWDSALRDAIHRQAWPALTFLAFAASFLGSVLFLAGASAISLVAFYRARWRHEAAVLAWLMGGAVVLNNALKFAFHRIRPEPFFGVAPESYSFPSGHALFSCCFYIALASALARHTRSRVVRAWIWLVAVFLVMAIGLSRVYLGVHYPSDVLGGYIAALFWVGVVLLMDRFGLLPKRDR